MTGTLIDDPATSNTTKRLQTEPKTRCPDLALDRTIREWRYDASI